MMIPDSFSYSLLAVRLRELEALSGKDARDADFLRWHALVELIVRKTFGLGSFEHSQFTRIGFAPFVGNTHPKFDSEAFQSGLQAVRIYVETLMSQLAWFDYVDESEQEVPAASHGQRLARILDRFHAIALELAVRNRKERAPLSIGDEYDVQYVLRALLTIEFSDVRLEEHTPSHAGASARADFLLKPERTIVEVKMTRAGLPDRKLGEELTVDIERYRKHPDCGELYCFVYDPEHRIGNAFGLEQDLSRTQPLPVSVLIRPKR
jgi:hypothetical protein